MDKELPVINAADGFGGVLKLADGAKFRYQDADGNQWLASKAGDTIQYDKLEKQASQTSKGVAAMLAGAAIRGGASIIGGAAGATKGNPAVGAFMASAAAEPMARDVEAWLANQPRTAVGPGEVLGSGLSGAVGMGMGSRVIGSAARQGMVQGAQASFLTELGKQIDNGQANWSDLATATAGGTAFGGVLGKLIGGKRNVSTPKQPKVAEVAEKVRREASEIQTTPIAKAEADNAVAVIDELEGKGQLKERGLVTSIKEEESIPDDLKDALNASYNVKSNADTYATVNDFITRNGVDGARDAFYKSKLPSAENNALGLELMRRYQADPAKTQEWADMAHELSKRATSQGQAIQVLATLGKATPEGQMVYASRVKGDALTPAETAGLKKLQDRLADSKNETQRIIRSGEVFEYIQGLSGEQATVGEKARAWSNLAMLLNPKTAIKNTAGNTLLFGANALADAFAVPVDAAVSVITGKGAVYGPQIAERFRGLGQPWRDFKAAAEGGSVVDGLKGMAMMAKLDSGAKLETGDISKVNRYVFSNKVARRAEDLMSIQLGAPDRAFKNAAYRASLENQRQAAADAGQIVPDDVMHARAVLDANRAVFQDGNFVSKGLNEIRKALNGISTLGQSTEYGAGQAVLPFTQVPGSIMLRMAEFSPIGFAKSLTEAAAPIVTKKQFDQKAFVDSFAEAAVGTAGLFSTGYALGKLGVITAADDEDPDIAALERGMGWGGYKINLSALSRRAIASDFEPDSELGRKQDGDLAMPYDWAQPVAAALAMGAELADREEEVKRALEKGKLTAAPSALFMSGWAGMKTLEDQPLLQGVSKLMRDSQVYGYIPAMGVAVGSLPQQMVPAVLNQVGQMMDRTIYETRSANPIDTAYKTIATRVPFAAKQLGLEPKPDVLGRFQERYGKSITPYWFDTFFNPALIEQLKVDPVGREVLDIYEKTGEKEQAPRAVPKVLTITTGGKELRIEPTAEQRAVQQHFFGSLVNDIFTVAVTDKKFQQLAPEEKAKKLAGWMSDINTATKVMLYGHRPKTANNFTKALVGQIVSSETLMKDVEKMKEYNK